MTGARTVSFDGVKAEIEQSIGVTLFTVLAWHAASGSLLRVHTNVPSANPVGSRKTNEVSDTWRTRVVERQETFFGPDRTSVREVFADWEAIERLGCGTVINVPVLFDGITVGVVNLLAPEGTYTPGSVAVAASIVGANERTLAALITRVAARYEEIPTQ